MFNFVSDSRIVHPVAKWHDVAIIFGPESEQSHTKAPGRVTRYCRDVIAQFSRATAAGAKTMQPPQDIFWGDRVCQRCQRPPMVLRHAHRSYRALPLLTPSPKLPLSAVD